jgi:penicillin-binding protein 1A
MKLLAVVLSIGAVCGAGLGVFFALIHDLPQIRALEDFAPSAVTRVYSADQVLLAELFAEKRDPIALEAVPEFLTAAVIATEDRKFYRHSGLDLKGIARAAFRNLQAGEFVEGASTLTQQLAKTLFLDPRKTLARKIKEAVLAIQLERRYTKGEILELYLNQIYFGSGAYGVESAARLYFGKSAANLKLAECALIAAMPRSPSRYSPLVNPDLALQRRNLVLRQMRETGAITERQFLRASKAPLAPLQPERQAAKAPYFVDRVRNFLEETIGADMLYKGGLRIDTTLEDRLQRAAEKAVSEGVAAFSVRAEARDRISPAPQAALVALEVQSGRILAMVGGTDYAKSPYNRAVTALRQPGSAFKPIVYAYAVEKGIPQNELILDAPIVYRSASGGRDWKPQNFSGSHRGEITLRRALAVSQNIPAVRLMERLRPERVIEFAHRLGIRSELRPNLSLALGSSEVHLMELVAAYSVFANQGRKTDPLAVTRVRDRNGRSLVQFKSERTAAMSRASAAIVTDMLTGVVQEGTAGKARVLGRSVAGKTGTTSDNRDAMFIGYSPTIAAGVWVGFDDGHPLGQGEGGSRTALPIWVQFMQEALREAPPAYFDFPDDVVRVPMNPHTGRPASEADGTAVQALFLRGSEPQR